MSITSFGQSCIVEKTLRNSEQYFLESRKQEKLRLTAEIQPVNKVKYVKE